jgi:putative oxidoreductase
MKVDGSTQEQVMSGVMTPPPAARDALLLLARVLVGVVLIAHGWQKFAEYGIGGTAGSFAQMGVPVPAVSAVFAAVVELVGGVALVAGAATVVVAALVVVDMLGAFLLVHAGNGVFVTDNGFELVWAIAAAALVLAAVGAGRFSVDHALLSRRRGGARG